MKTCCHRSAVLLTEFSALSATVIEYISAWAALLSVPNLPIQCLCFAVVQHVCCFLLLPCSYRLYKYLQTYQTIAVFWKEAWEEVIGSKVPLTNEPILRRGCTRSRHNQSVRFRGACAGSTQQFSDCGGLWVHVLVSRAWHEKQDSRLASLVKTHLWHPNILEI